MSDDGVLWVSVNTFEDKTLAQSSLNETTAHRDSVAAYLKTIKPSCGGVMGKGWCLGRI